jgi:DNA polymerase III subunit epsilon
MRAIVAGRLAQAIAARITELRLNPISLHDFTAGWADEQAASFRLRTDAALDAGRGRPVRS